IASAPRIIANRIQGAKDAGISFGPRSNPLVFANVISDCKWGVSASENCEPMLLRNDIQGNKVGIHARLKDRDRPGGGVVSLIDSRIAGNIKDADCDARFPICNAGTQIGPLAGLTAPSGAEPLLAMYGILAGMSPPGLPAKWETIAPVAPLYSEYFRDDFGDDTAGWTGAKHLIKRNNGLLIRTDGFETTASGTIDWNLADPARTTFVVLECAAPGISTVEIGLACSGGPEVHTLPGTLGPGEYRLAVLRVPAGHYERLEIRLSPRAHDAHFVLHRVMVLA